MGTPYNITPDLSLTEDPLVQRKDGWLPTWPISPPSHHPALGTEMFLVRKMLQEHQLEGSGDTSPG